MSFQVKITVVAFLGNTDVYPCHMRHRIGDEVTFDGESYSGRLCPDVWPLIVPKVTSLYQAGPRYVDWASYYPFWYTSLSKDDPEQRNRDGLGFRNTLKTIVPSRYDMANLVPLNAFKWPPHEKRTIAGGASVICPDTRTSMLIKLEAFDLCEKGSSIPYFRRQMAILAKLLLKKGIRVDRIIDAFSKTEVEEIYPALGPVIVQILTEELELMGYAETIDGMTSITSKGRDKLERFKSSLPDRDRGLFEEYEK